MSNYSWWMGNQEHAIESGQRALALNESLGDFTLQVQTNFRLGQAFFALGDYRQASSFLTRNVDLLTGYLLPERFGLAGLASVLSRYSLACALAEQGAFAEAMACGEEGLRVAEAGNHPFSLVLATFGIGLSALRQGVFHTAIPLLERGLTLCRNRDIPVFFAWLAAALGYARGLAGQVTEALPLLEQAVEHVIALRIRFSYALWVAWLSEVYLLASRPEEAQGHAMHALELSRAYKEHGNEAWVLRLLADIAAHRHPLQGEQAILSYRQALTLAEERGMRPLQAHCHYGLGTVYATTGQQEQARAALATAIEMYRAMEMTFWLPQTAAALAQVEAQ
jgi:tetratricopeptide (TPR) repeat protein